MRALFHSLVLVATSPRMVESLTVGLTISPWLLLMRQAAEQYFFADWQFLCFLLVLIVVDTISGVLRSWRQRQVSSRAFSRVFSKVLVYLLLLVLAHIMTHFTVRGQVNVLFQWFDTFIYSAMMAREALSLLENLAAIEPGLVPKPLLKRLALFSEDPEAGLRALVPIEPTPAPEALPESIPVTTAPQEATIL